MENDNIETLILKIYLELAKAILQKHNLDVNKVEKLLDMLFDKKEGKKDLW